MRLPTIVTCLLWIAIVAVSSPAQNTSPKPPPDQTTTSEMKFKTPDDAILKFGHLLGDVIAQTDKQEAMVRSEGHAKTLTVQKQLDDIDNGADPESAQYMKDVKPVETDCPAGRVLPADQLATCRSRIAAINEQFAKLKARHDDLEGQKNQIAADQASKIATLELKKSKATALDTQIEACSGNPDTMTKKACLDHIFENPSHVHDGYDLDPGVVKPDYLGSTKSSATIVQSQNKVHDDEEIRKAMKKKTPVPPPSNDQTPPK